MTQPTWQPEATKHLKNVPFLFRGLAKKKIEKAAIDKNVSEITIKFMEEIRAERNKK